MKRYFLVVLFLILIALTACSGSGNTGSPATTDRPARAVEEYLSSKIRSDQAGIRAGLCSAMEADLERELHAFESVTNAMIENMSCLSDDPKATSETVVRCAGEIVALYGTEETKFPLTSYRSVNEDGEWRWCGESE